MVLGGVTESRRRKRKEKKGGKITHNCANIIYSEPLWTSN
jgi:hypothetical protein